MKIRVAITGLQRGDNPQPGAAIVRSLRRTLEVEIVGLVYDAYESGIYVEGGVDSAHVMPYPTCGAAAWLGPLDEVRAHSPFDVLMPTLDSEIDLLAGAPEEFARRGIRCPLPAPETLARRDKKNLALLGEECGVPVPEQIVVRDLRGALAAARRIGWPVFIKGQYYDARLADGADSLTEEASAILANWGPPLIVQKPVAGPEFDVLGVGDGRGGTLGMCAIRKTHLSNKGKGIGAVTVRDPRLEEASRRVVEALAWHGPFELEWILGPDGYTLIEMNPRFPAWVDFPSQLGANFATAWMEELLGNRPAPLPVLPPGRFFLRHQIEVVGDIGRLASLLAETGDLLASGYEIRPYPTLASAPGLLSGLDAHRPAPTP